MALNLLRKDHPFNACSSLRHRIFEKLFARDASTRHSTAVTELDCPILRLDREMGLSDASLNEDPDADYLDEDLANELGGTYSGPEIHRSAVDDGDVAMAARRASLRSDLLRRVRTAAPGCTRRRTYGRNATRRAQARATRRAPERDPIIAVAVSLGWNGASFGRRPTGALRSVRGKRPVSRARGRTGHRVGARRVTSTRRATVDSGGDSADGPPAGACGALSIASLIEPLDTAETVHSRPTIFACDALSVLPLLRAAQRIASLCQCAIVVGSRSSEEHTSILRWPASVKIASLNRNYQATEIRHD
jgi:hypothetical protein